MSDSSNEKREKIDDIIKMRRDEKIRELEQKLNYKKVVDIAKTKKGYAYINNVGGISFSPYSESASPLTKNMRSKMHKMFPEYQKESIEKDMSPTGYGRESILNDIDALKKGYDSYWDMEKAKKQKLDDTYDDRKKKYDSSILSNLIGKDYYQEADKEFYPDISKIMGLISDTAKKRGAELYHTSKENGRPSSYYLRKNNRKVRLSNHELPQIMDRNSPEYQETWDKNLTFNDNKVVNRFVEPTTNEDWESLVDGLFSEE